MDPEDPDSDQDHSQNWIISSFYLFRHILKIWSKSVHKLLSYLVHKQTHKPTNKPRRKHNLLDRGNKPLASLQRCNKSTIRLVYLIFSFIFSYYDARPMIPLHTPYLIKQPIKPSVLFLNIVKMLILILQVKCDKVCWNMVKNSFHYERNHISVYIFKCGYFRILLLTQVQLELTCWCYMKLKSVFWRLLGALISFTGIYHFSMYMSLW